MNNKPALSPEDIRVGKVPLEGSGIEIRKTICDICNPQSHCGIDAYVKDGVVIKVAGTKENLHSAGTLCSKGAASRQYIYNEDRVRTPLMRRGKRGSDDFEPISWDRALEIISSRLIKIKSETGPESVLFYAGYPKWMRPLLKRMAHSFGSPNYMSESSVCSIAQKLGQRLTYGVASGAQPPKAKCLMVWSKNPFYSNTAVARKLTKVIEKGVKIIEVGPLTSHLSKHAHIHLRIRPGTSGALALGLANVIINEGLYDRDFVEKWTEGFDAYRAYVMEFPPSKASEITGVPVDLIEKAARLYATSKPAGLMTGSNPTVHHTNGITNHRLLTALIGLTGNFDIPGGNYVKFPGYLYASNGLVTRQSEFSQSRPWDEMAPRVSQDTFPVWCKMEPEAQAMHIPFQIQSGKPYPIRAMVAFGLNYRMWPGSDFMQKSLKMLDFLVDVELFMTDSAKLADIILPACSSFERSELKFYSSPYVIWTQPVIEPLWESRPDNEIIVDLARRIAPDDSLLGSGHEACIDWMLEPTGLTLAELKKYPGGYPLKDVPQPPYKKYEDGGFKTPSGKMEFTSRILEEFGMDPLPRYVEPKLSPISTPEIYKDYPLILTTGARLPMFVHSRTFRIPWLKGLRPDPMVDINPKDAKERGLSLGDPVSLFTPRGAIQVKANPTELVPPGVVNMFHAYPEADVNTLIEPDYLDPISGFPGFKALLCQVKKLSK